jgi:hypothetical protein
MFWIETKAVLTRFVLLVLLTLSLADIAYGEPARIPEMSRAEAWLVTYGPGEIYWQRFGHNAIWIRNPDLGLDHAFNFGFFDFEQQNFFIRFLQGRMLYFSAAQPVRDEFSAYIAENRGIQAQKLNLTSGQLSRLTAYLLREIRPDRRDYLYDYYDNNCSTRVRDAIDLALDGALAAEFGSRAASQTQRDQTRRLTSGDFWLYLGLEIGLGAPVDQPISRWDEMFIPEILAGAIESMTIDRSGVIEPLVTEEIQVYQSALEPPPAQPARVWPRYLLASLAVVALCGLLGRWLPTAVLAKTWLGISGLIGLALLFLWFGTDHEAARLNLNLLVFSPLWLVLAFWPRGARGMFYLLCAISVFAVLMTRLPPGQYTLDVLAAFLPLNLAAGLALYRNSPG